MIAVRTFWRYTLNHYPYQHPLSDSVKETTNEGDGCDWAKGSAYEQLGWCVPCE